MKTFKLSLFALIISVTAHAQDLFTFVGAGLTYNSEPGYYLGVSAFGRTSSKFSFGAELQWIREGEFNSINGTMGYKLHLNGTSFSLFAGPRFGIITNHKNNFEDGMDNNIKFGPAAGINYEIKRFEIVTRYYYEVNSDLANNVFVGCNYRLRK